MYTSGYKTSSDPRRNNFITSHLEIRVISLNVINSSSHTRFNISGLLKIQTLLKVRQGQYKNFLLQLLFYIELWGWDMAQNVNLWQKMRTEKTEKRWYFLKDDDHRWLFDNRNVGDNYWKTGKTWHFVTQGDIAR